MGFSNRSVLFRTSDGRSIALRNFGPRDAPSLLEFANAMFDEKEANPDLGVVSFDRQATLAEEREFLSEMIRGLRRKETVSVAAFDGKRLVGHCNIKRRMRSDVMHAGTLGIVVLDGYRGVGLGERLMSEALLQARQIGVWLVQLTLFENNAAAAGLYRKVGFRKAGVIPDKIVRNGRHLDEVIMYADLRATDKSSSRRRRKS